MDSHTEKQEQFYDFVNSNVINAKFRTFLEKISGEKKLSVYM